MRSSKLELLAFGLLLSLTWWRWVVPVDSMQQQHTPPPALSLPRGCAGRSPAAPKAKIVVLGGGGGMGGHVFGFLQRSAAIPFETGIGSYRCIGATAETSLQLNKVLSSSFCLAFADESAVKLTNLFSVSAITQRLEGWDALILGTDVFPVRRKVTPNTYDRTPNDWTWELLWDGTDQLTNALDKDENVEMKKELTEIKNEILGNVVQAAKAAKIQHVVVVNRQGNSPLVNDLRTSGIPFTCIQPLGPIDRASSYTYRKGVQGDLSIVAVMDDDDEDNYLAGPAASDVVLSLSREDIAALCVEVLQSLDWSKNRCLRVQCIGPAPAIPTNAPRKRPDQEWCCNSILLRNKLFGIL